MAERDRNVRGSQRNVASREETYNQRWQSMGLNVVGCQVTWIQHPRSVTDTLIDREITQQDITELECEDINDQNPTACYGLGCSDCHGCWEHSVNVASLLCFRTKLSIAFVIL